MPVTVALIQYPAKFGDVQANREHLTELIVEAAKQGAQLVVVPEAAVTGYIAEDLRTNWHLPGRTWLRGIQKRHPETAAQTVPGPTTTHFAKLAKQLGIFLTTSFVERADPHYFNTMCLLSPSGELVSHYRKLHPYPLTEQGWATPGDRGLQTFDTPFGRVGLAICYDIHFLLPMYREQQLSALLFASAWYDVQVPTYFFHGELPSQLPALGYHVLAANWSVKTAQRWYGAGYSSILSRTGTVLATAQTQIGSEIVLASLPTVGE